MDGLPEDLVSSAKLSPGDVKEMETSPDGEELSDNEEEFVDLGGIVVDSEKSDCPKASYVPSSCHAQE